MKWPERKVTAHVYKEGIGWMFRLKAHSIEDATQKAIDRTSKDRPDIMQAQGRLCVEFIFGK